ncbi:MAG: SurA N-terminal domain-containing protein, partial [Deltaproteobacteria bacterium]|nr:SurA N-terminal domain-containing protein [Deltaproteobacteria bacterium]
MLDYIRKRSGGIIGFLIIGAIALVFVFWGVGGQNTGEISNIVMDDEKIPVQYYLELKRDAMEQLRSQGEGIDPDILNQAAAQRALSNLTQRHVLRKLAAGTGRSIPEQELVRQITSQPAFQDENGVFRKSLYEQYVSQATNFSVATFEQRFADDLLVTSTADFVYGLAFTPTKELDERYHLTEDQVKLNYAYFPVASFTEGLEPTEEETKDYYERNKEAFRRPAELRADYVTVEPNSFLDGVEVTDEEISAQYEEERSRLTSQPSAEVRHILFRFPSFYPSAEDKAAVLKKADDAMARLATEDFATLARELSEDPATAPKGGDLGTLRKGATVKEFEDAVYGLGAANVGKPIGPIETNFGYHIILVESYTPPKTTPLEVAKPELEREIRERKARRAAVDRIEDLYDRVQRDPSLGLRQVADALGLEVRGSEFF